MTSLQERVDRLVAATADGPDLEQLLLHEPILQVAPNGTPHQGASTTFLVIFESRGRAILKPFGGQHPNACAQYSQDALECVTHEAAAWRLAHAIGDPFDQLLPIAILRDIPGTGAGALINWREGTPDDSVFVEAPAQAHAAAFWDALIAQQDRHMTNFRYDAASRRLALIDSGFAFACPGHLLHSSVFLEHRLAEHGPALTGDEIAILERTAAEDLHGLSRFLAEERVEALRARVGRMLKSGNLPAPGEF